MKKLLIITFTALALTGCAVNGTISDIASAVQSFTITQNQVDFLRNSYNAAFLAPAARYRQLPRCQVSQTFVKDQCRDPNIVRQLQAIDKTVKVNFDTVQGLLDTGDNKGLSAAWTLLQEAVTSAKNYAFTVGIV